VTTVPFGRVVDLVRDKAVPGGNFSIGLEAVESGTGRLVAEPVTDYEGSGTAFRRGDLLFGKLRPYLAKAWLADRDGAAVGDFHVYRPHLGTHPGYLRWVLLARNFLDPVQSSVFGAKMPRADWAFIRNVAIHLPAVKEQHAIADYLDRETSRIDTFIEEQQRLIELLRERRWAVIERSVALLDWDTPFKAVAVLIQTGPFGSQLKSDEYEEGGTPVINPSHVVGGEVCPDPRVAVGHGKALALARHAFEEGDLVAARRGELGRCAVVDSTSAGFLCGTGSALIRLNKSVIEPNFAALVFGSRRNREALALASVGSTMDNLNSDIIGALRIPVPPRSEQRRIVAEGTQAVTQIDAMIAETELFVELSEERRSALITAAVTGQIDVREVA
jgi:type I restriction enzyme S subunit